MIDIDMTTLVTLYSIRNLLWTITIVSLVVVCIVGFIFDGIGYRYWHPRKIATGIAACIAIVCFAGTIIITLNIEDYKELKAFKDKQIQTNK